jgi:hypothetical protein
MTPMSLPQLARLPRGRCIDGCSHTIEVGRNAFLAIKSGLKLCGATCRCVCLYSHGSCSKIPTLLIDKQHNIQGTRPATRLQSQKRGNGFLKHPPRHITQWNSPKNSRISCTISSGHSIHAKCPPKSLSVLHPSAQHSSQLPTQYIPLKNLKFVVVVSAPAFGTGNASYGNVLTPSGTLIKFSSFALNSVYTSCRTLL